MKYFYLVSASFLLAAIGAPARAQLQDGEAPTPEQVAAGEVVANPVEEKEQALRALHAQMAAVRWTRPAAEELLAYIQRIGEEGLDPLDYSADRLEAALAGRDDAVLSFTATDIFLRVSADLALGHARSDGRVDWFASDDDLNSNIQFELMQRAIANNNIRDTLISLLPTHPQYAELKAVLASTQDQATRDVVRANLDRWRWLPRDLGKRYVIVNVPAYTAALVEDGRVVARHKVIVGKPGTATPQLSAVATGVIFNPWWEVPESISGEVRGKRGYVSVKNGEKIRYRQPPGPSNALGRMKVVMPNDYAIYLHDTPSKSLFKKQVRAFSHGCIRTEDALGFAQLLLANPAWDKAAIDRTIAAKKTVKAEATISTPVYIAYFTAAALQNGGGIRSYPDLYGRDAKVVTALNSRSGEVDIAAAGTR